MPDRPIPEEFDDDTNLAEAVALHFLRVVTQEKPYQFEDPKADETYEVKFKPGYDHDSFQVQPDEAHRLMVVEDKVSETEIVLDYTIIFNDNGKLEVDDVEIVRVGEEDPRWYYVRKEDDEELFERKKKAA